MNKNRKAEMLGLKPAVIHRFQNFPSLYLDRKVMIDIFLPPNYQSLDQPCHTLYFNDGQQAVRMRLAETLDKMHRQGKIEPLILVAIYAGPERLQEYGTAAMADYSNRGSKAAAYSFFILNELMPYIERNYKVGKDASHRAFAGFSLGGLSAFDIVWHNTDLFSKVGVFSGSFWWRRKKLGDEYSEDDRIMHHLVPAGDFHDHLRMWFSAGTDEEKADRNNNGIIDVIDDVLDLMAELNKLGYDEQHMKYVEVEGGQHNEESWAAVLPSFLTWALGRESK